MVDRIIELVKEKGLSLNAVEKELGFGNGAIKRFKTNSPSIDKLIKLSNFLNTSLEYLVIGSKSVYSELNSNEVTILSSLKNLNEKGIEKLLERIEELSELSKYKKKTSEKAINNKDIHDELSITTVDNEIDIIDIQELKNIKLYQAPVSAGLGTWLDNDVPYEMLKVDLKTCPQARRCDFALKVRGDSMEPYYYDGDIVYIKEQPAVDNGQIGIFLYNNDSYIKKLSITKDTVYLISFNEKYKPIKINEDSNFKCFGLVL